MPMTEAQYAELMENTEQVITARNLEEYLVENPGPYPPPPDPTYAEWLPVGLAQFVACVQAALGTGFAARGTTGSDGKLTVTYPEMETPVVTASVVDATQDNTYFQVAIESVSSTQAVLRVTQTAGTTLLGIPLLTVPSLAVGATVHVQVLPATEV